MNSVHRYRKLSDYFKEKFNARVYRVPIDAGFTCPNRDGTLDSRGCIFCDETGARARQVRPELSIREQILNGIKSLRTRYKAQKFIAYFQAYSNTYADVKTLERYYKEALDSHDDIIGISISTRPDLLGEDVLALLHRISMEKFVMVEVGVQSFVQKSLVKVRRFHNVSDTLFSLLRLKETGNINIVAHLIMGLPGETPSEMLETGRILSLLDVDGIKLHHLYVVRGTDLEKLYTLKKIRLMFTKPEDYAAFVVEFLREISPKIVIHRLQGYAGKDILVAPAWTSDRHIIENMVGSIMEKENIYQGDSYKFT